MTTTARDFLALGTVRWLLRELTVAMGHVDALDHDSLTRELLAGAHAWQIGDWASAVNRLRAGFEVLTQARERFYPVDAYLIDLCLLDPAMPAGVLADPLENPDRHLVHRPGAGDREPGACTTRKGMAALRQAISDGWADVAGGDYSEAEDPLLPLESILWQFRRGDEVYRAHLDDRNVETYARRRFGLYTQLPQIAKRFGFRYRASPGFRRGPVPDPSRDQAAVGEPRRQQSRELCCARRWRPTGRRRDGLFPWRMAATMKDDHVAALPLVHWPKPVAPWYLDLRRAAGYSPVLGRWTTLNDFFHLTDRPYETFRPEPDHLPIALPGAGGGQARARADRADGPPPSACGRGSRRRGRSRRWRGRSRASAAGAATEPGDAGRACPRSRKSKTLIETGRHDEAATALGRVVPAWSAALARGIVGSVGLADGRLGELASGPATWSSTR